MKVYSCRVPIAVLVLISIAAAPALGATKCTMSFTLSGWSAIYKRASGRGGITCDNGQTADVTIRAVGGGLTFGKSKVVNGRGTFSEVESINELFGDYANAEVHAGAGKSSTAQALTKGTVSLGLTGTGEGVDLGFDFGKFTISRATAKKK
jgi:hypothetical protein